MSAINLEQLTFDFIEDRKARDLSPRSIKYYEESLKLFSNWLQKNNIENPNLSDLNPINLRRFFSDLATHRNRGGCHCIYRAIKALTFFIDLNEYDEKWKNPIKKITIPANKIKPIEGISLDDISKMISACDGRFKLRNVCILKTLLDTCARAQELLDLNVGDIYNSNVKILRGKGDEPRTVYIGKSTEKSLKEYLATRQNLLPESPLFVNENGERLKYSGLRMIIARLAKKIGGKEGIHNFRRAGALALFHKKVPVLLISMYLGHGKGRGNLEVTKRYLAINDEDIKDAIFSPADDLV